MKRYSLIILSIIFIASGSFAQYYSKDVKEILTLQDTRTLGKNDKLLKFLKSNNPGTINRALIALGNIADTNSINAIGEKLLNGSDTVKIVAAVVIGNFPNSIAQKYLIESLETEKSPLVLYRVIESLGKIGDETALKKILEFKPGTDVLNSAIAMSIARFSIRKIKNADSIQKLKEILQVSNGPKTKQNAAFAFYRIGDKTLLTGAKDEIISLTADTNPFTRMWAYGALGRLQDNSNLKYILDKFNSEPDWRVKINMLNAAGSLKLNGQDFFNEDYLKILTTAAADTSNCNTSITALQILGKLFTDSVNTNPLLAKLKEDLTGIFENENLPWQIRGEASKTLGKIFEDGVKNELLKIYSSTENLDLKGRYYPFICKI